MSFGHDFAQWVACFFTLNFKTLSTPTESSVWVKSQNSGAETGASSAAGTSFPSPICKHTLHTCDVSCWQKSVQKDRQTDRQTLLQCLRHLQDQLTLLRLVKKRLFPGYTVWVCVPALCAQRPVSKRRRHESIRKRNVSQWSVKRLCGSAEILWLRRAEKH